MFPNAGNGARCSSQAFSIGRTQELLCELEDIIHRNRQRAAAPGRAWKDLTIVVDSPLATDFTEGYAKLKMHWDEEARSQAASGRHPLDFAQLKTVGPHELHLKIVKHLAQSHEPAIVRRVGLSVPHCCTTPGTARRGSTTSIDTSTRE